MAKGSPSPASFVELGRRTPESIDCMGNRAPTRVVIDVFGVRNEDEDVPAMRGCKVREMVDWVVFVEFDGVEENTWTPELDTHEHGWTLAEGVETPRRQGLK